MGIIARLYDFVAGTRIRSANVDAEFDQLVAGHNDHDTKIDGLQAGTGLVDGGVITAKIANGAVTTIKIADLAVTTNKIAVGALDGRYYTETESDAKYETITDLTTNRKLSAAGDFTGTLNGQPITSTDPGLSSAFIALRNSTVGGIVNANEKYGAIGDGVTDDTTATQNSINLAIANGSKLVFFSAGLYNVDTSSLVNADQVTFSGDGASFVDGESLNITQLGKRQTGSALYNRAIHEMSIVPKDSLITAREAVQSGTLKVLMVGDSTTEGADQTEISDSYAVRFQNLLVKSLPSATVTYANYAISGNTLIQFLDPTYIPYGIRPWATVVSQDWYTYARLNAPDLIVVGFGLNESTSPGSDKAFAANLATLIARISTWPKVPSIVLVPTMLATKNTSLYNFSQQGAKAVARVMREFAIANKLAYADANRLFQILRDGIDDVTRQGTQESFSTFGTTYWTGDVSSFNLVGNSIVPIGAASGKFVARNRTVYNSTIQVSVTPAALGNVGWINYRIDSTFGYLSVRVVPGNTSNGVIQLYNGVTLLAASAAVTIPSASASIIKVVANGTNHKIYLNAVLMVDYTGYECMHDGTWGVGSDLLVPTFSALTAIYSDPISAEPPYTETELLGRYNQAEESGSGLSHLSGFGNAMVYVPAFYGVVRELSATPIATTKTNLLINGKFDRNVRATSYTGLTQLYTLDRWGAFANEDGGTHPTMAITQEQATPGDIFNSFYYYRFTTNGAGTSLGTNSLFQIYQKIENATRKFAGSGKKLKVSFLARSSISGKKIGIGMAQNYGSGGSPSAQETINGSNWTLTTDWKKYNTIITTNTLVGKTFGTSGNDSLNLNFYVMWGATIASRVGASGAETYGGSGTIDIDDVIVEPVEPVQLLNYTLDRYCIAYTDASVSFPVGIGIALSTTQVIVHVEFPVTMRAAPTLVATAADWKVSDGVTATDLTAISIVSGQSSNKTVTLLCTVASGLTQFRSYQLVADGTANRQLTFEAEL